MCIVYVLEFEDQIYMFSDYKEYMSFIFKMTDMDYKEYWRGKNIFYNRYIQNDDGLVRVIIVGGITFTIKERDIYELTFSP